MTPYKLNMMNINLVSLAYFIKGREKLFPLTNDYRVVPIKGNGVYRLYLFCVRVKIEENKLFILNYHQHGYYNGFFVRERPGDILEDIKINLLHSELDLLYNDFINLITNKFFEFGLLESNDAIIKMRY